MNITDVLTDDPINQVVHNLSFEEYVKIPAVNGSLLCSHEAETSLVDLREKAERPEDRSKKDYIEFGSAVDDLATEYAIPRFEKAGGFCTEAFDDAVGAWRAERVCVYEDKWDKRHKAFQLACATGKRLLRSEEQVEDAIEVAELLLTNPVLEQFWLEGEAQVTLLWDWHGIQCKSRIDWLATKCEAGMAICDIKCTDEIGPGMRTFYNRAFRPFRYADKMAFYRKAVERVTGNRIDDCRNFVARVKRPFYVCCTEPFPLTLLDNKLAQIEERLLALRSAIESGVWPGVVGEEPGTAIPLPISDWEMSETSERIDFGGGLVL